MVRVTERARRELKRALADNIEEPGVGLRLHQTDEGQFTLSPDTEREGDEVVEHEGEVLLLIGEDVAEPLDGATIDCRQTAEGAQLVVSKLTFPTNGAVYHRAAVD